MAIAEILGPPLRNPLSIITSASVCVAQVPPSICKGGFLVMCCCCSSLQLNVFPQCSTLDHGGRLEGDERSIINFHFPFPFSDPLLVPQGLSPLPVLRKSPDTSQALSSSFVFTKGIPPVALQLIKIIQGYEFVSMSQGSNTGEGSSSPRTYMAKLR